MPHKMSDAADFEGDAVPQTLKTVALIHEPFKITKRPKAWNAKRLVSDDLELIEVDPVQTAKEVKRPVQMAQTLRMLQEQFEFLSQVNTRELSNVSATQHEDAAPFPGTRRSPLRETHVNVIEFPKEVALNESERPSQFVKDLDTNGRKQEFSSNTVSFISP